jgi:hypothetical protein
VRGNDSTTSSNPLLRSPTKAGKEMNSCLFLDGFAVSNASKNLVKFHYLPFHESPKVENAWKNAIFWPVCAIEWRFSVIVSIFFANAKLPMPFKNTTPFLSLPVSMLEDMGNTGKYMEKCNISDGWCT